MTRLLVVACALTIAACASSHKTAPSSTTAPLSLRANDAALATPATPMPSPSPLTAQERLRIELNASGASVNLIRDGFAYVSDTRGLRKMRISDRRVVWEDAQCSPVGARVSIVDDVLYASCKPQTLNALDDSSGVQLRSAAVPMWGVSRVENAGPDAVAVEGWNDGAALRNELVLLRRNSLRPIVEGSIEDSTFLGVIGDRAYIDDWCCNGRPDEYLPATVYWISLKDGSRSAPVDLRPDADRYAGRFQPLGQGGSNFLRGKYLYVPVGKILYRYDITNLSLPPARLPNPNADG